MAGGRFSEDGGRVASSPLSSREEVLATTARGEVSCMGQTQTGPTDGPWNWEHSKVGRQAREQQIIAEISLYRES